jgi:hypothetical protein
MDKMEVKRRFLGVPDLQVPLSLALLRLLSMIPSHVVCTARAARPADGRTNGVGWGWGHPAETD